MPPTFAVNSEVNNLHLNILVLNVTFYLCRSMQIYSM